MGTSGYSAHYLVISHSLLFQKWKFNFHDNLSRQFLDKIDVHKGIESLAIEVYEHPGFKDIVKNNKKYVSSIPFVVIGHDLAGAVAALLAMKLKTEGLPNPRSYYFRPTKVYRRSGSPSHGHSTTHARDH